MELSDSFLWVGLCEGRGRGVDGAESHRARRLSSGGDGEDGDAREERVMGEGGSEKVDAEGHEPADIGSLASGRVDGCLSSELGGAGASCRAAGLSSDEERGLMKKKERSIDPETFVEEEEDGRGGDGAGDGMRAGAVEMRSVPGFG